VENFAGTGFKHKVLILGDMLELGSESAAEHRAIAALATGIGAEQVFLVGKEFGGCEGSDIAAGNVKFFPSAEELRAQLEKSPLRGKTVLIKGSNGMHLGGLEAVL